MASLSENRHHHPDDRHLPNDILIDVLKRLPVKSLLRFKCVSKNWYDLIQNPHFAQTHLRFQKLHNKGRLLLQHFNDGTGQYGYALFPDETLANDEYHHLDHVRGGVHIEGPINGLFCLFNRQDIVILWNPAIREFRNLPYPTANLPSYLRFCKASIGFGLDQLTDYDHKVVLIRRFSNPKRHWDVCRNVMVYSLRTNTWRQLDCLDGLPNGNKLPSSNKSTTYLNGVYHWFSLKKSANGFACAVVAFDMGKEVFREIPGPDIGQSDLSKPICDLSLYDDHVTLHHLKRFDPTEIDIWVMEMEGTWVKRFALGPLPGVECQLGFWKTGELLFETYDDSLEPCGNPSSQVVIYNTSTHEFRELGPKGTHDSFKAGVYYESLVSVEGGKYQRKGKLSELSMQYFFLPDYRRSFMDRFVRLVWYFQRSGIEQSLKQMLRDSK